MGFFPNKNDFWLQNQKIGSKILQPWTSNHPSTNISNLTSNQETEAHTEEKESRRICRYDWGLELYALLETRVLASCPWGSANGICTNTFPKATPISWWPLLFSQVSQCTHMKEISQESFRESRKSADFQVFQEWQENTRLWLRTLI